ncbi:MAG: ribokinase [Saprospiraceae bacterium]|jgi:ribokinase
MTSKSIIVIGSTNMDMVVRTPRLPAPGETILGDSFIMNPGGKGANQAVAIARLGGEVTFVSKIGNDIFGAQSRELFKMENINSDFLMKDDDNPSGVALITVDEKGENIIVVAPGSNSNLNPEDVRSVFERIAKPDFLVTQLEIPLETVRYALEYAHSNGIRTILNPAPANLEISDIFGLVDYITPNKSEAELLSGVKIIDLKSVELAARTLQKKGPKNIIITLGEEGAAFLENDHFEIIPGVKVEARDSTAAGDTFNGALVVALSEDKNLAKAIEFACHASAITVTRAGAQSSIPNREELLIDILTSYI